MNYSKIRNGKENPPIAINKYGIVIFPNQERLIFITLLQDRSTEKAVMNSKHKRTTQMLVLITLVCLVFIEGCTTSGSNLRGETGQDKEEFVRYDNGIVYHQSSDIEWIAGPDEDTTFVKADYWAHTLDTDGGGWRLPTANELRTLYDPGKGPKNITPLLKTTGWHVWTSDSDSQWNRFFSFIAGQVQRETNSRHYAANGDSKRGFAVRVRADKKYKKLDQKYASLVKYADITLINKMGIDHTKEGDFYAAIWFFSEAIEKSPLFHQAYYNRGICFEHLGKYSKALVDFNKAIDVHPKFSSAYARRGLLYAFNMKFDEAKQNIDKAITIDPKNGLGFVSRALMLYKLEKYEASWDNVKKAQDLSYRVDPELIRALNVHLDIE